MGITSLVGANVDLLLVGVAVAGMILLGSIVIFNDPRSVTNRTFFFFSLLTAVWGVSNYFEYHFATVAATLWALRTHLFVSVWHAFSFFTLAFVFPQEKMTFPRWYAYGLLPLVAFTSVIAFSPLTFSGVALLAPPGEVSRAVPGPGIALFSLTAFGCLLSGIWILLIRTVREKAQQKKQDAALLSGMTLTAILILTFNVVLPNLFADVSFIPLAALFVFPFIALTFYAIYKHHLFNLKVATTAFLGFMVTVFSFVNILYSQSASAIMINVTAFAIILLGSIRIVRDTFNLEQINAQQERLLHFISHEVKAYLTKSVYAFASIKGEDFGPISPELKQMSNDALIEMKEGVATVIDILDAANLKKGTMTYHKKPFDFSATVVQTVRQLTPAADAKHVRLDMMTGEGSYILDGDEEKISQHVIRNLIDNAIKYTPAGDIHIDLARTGNTIRFSVKDNGVGITPEDMVRLFTEGGKGKDSTKVNAHSTGYGLFVAKTVVSAHGGKIWAESRGAGVGARFVVEFPVM